MSQLTSTSQLSDNITMAKHDPMTIITPIFLERYNALFRLYRNVPKATLVFDQNTTSKALCSVELLPNRLTFHTSLSLPSGDTLAEVIAHQLAHLLAYKIDGSTLHSQSWKKAMERQGYDPVETFNRTRQWCAKPILEHQSMPARSLLSLLGTS
ncbi:MAG: hypothetical protein HWE20_07415 [Gammaproteobacteria bacterium]|nr:hypothetical protein [Gammaproteobacteria bacterium]